MEWYVLEKLYNDYVKKLNVLFCLNTKDGLINVHSCLIIVMMPLYGYFSNNFWQCIHFLIEN